MKNLWVIEQQAENTDKIKSIQFHSIRREARENLKWLKKYIPDCCDGLVKLKYRIKQYKEVIPRKEYCREEIKGRCTKA